MIFKMNNSELPLASGVAKFQEALKVCKLSVGMNWNGEKLSGVCGNLGN